MTGLLSYAFCLTIVRTPHEGCSIRPSWAVRVLTVFTPGTGPHIYHLEIRFPMSLTNWFITFRSDFSPQEGRGCPTPFIRPPKGSLALGEILIPGIAQPSKRHLRSRVYHSAGNVDIYVDTLLKSHTHPFLTVL